MKSLPPVQPSATIPRRIIMCKYRGCKREATCLPRVYCPASIFSANGNAEDISSLMGIPFCDVCFKKVAAKELLYGPGGEQIREQITKAFRQRNAYPNFDKAVVGRVSRFDTDWQVYLQMLERTLRN